MKLKQFRAKNFRCLYDPDWIILKDPTVLIGCNDGGKTATIEALDYFFSNTPPPLDAYSYVPNEPPDGEGNRPRESEIVLEAVFTLSEQDKGLLQDVLLSPPTDSIHILKIFKREDSSISFDMKTDAPQDRDLPEDVMSLSIGQIRECIEKYNIPNPKFASRDGCWQGNNGYSNVVLGSHIIKDGKVEHKKGKSFNGNASVLDPVACEVILRFFMPTNGKRVYNPFGGGVQFGFIAGSYGYEYIASEIRQNQCDANNAICQDLNSATWIKSDSSDYEPDGMFDLCFMCPPYYKVEKYIDYNDEIPDGELNNMATYEQFRDTLFKGYKKAIEHLNDNCFFVVMTGDSRGGDGAYYGSEAEHELFFKEQGLYIYNKIVYLECEFTRLAHAKRTLDYRKFPKREQKILVFYKGNMKKIKELYPPIGRL